MTKFPKNSVRQTKRLGMRHSRKDNCPPVFREEVVPLLVNLWHLLDWAAVIEPTYQLHKRSRVSARSLNSQCISLSLRQNQVNHLYGPLSTASFSDYRSLTQLFSMLRTVLGVEAINNTANQTQLVALTFGENDVDHLLVDNTITPITLLEQLKP